MKAGFISLGCSKNLVDTEIMLGELKNHGIELTNNPAEADILIVNTCAFIQSAKEESRLRPLFHVPIEASVKISSLSG